MNVEIFINNNEEQFVEQMQDWFIDNPNFVVKHICALFDQKWCLIFYDEGVSQ